MREPQAIHNALIGLMLSLHHGIALPKGRSATLGTLLSMANLWNHGMFQSNTINTRSRPKNHFSTGYCGFHEGKRTDCPLIRVP